MSIHIWISYCIYGLSDVSTRIGIASGTTLLTTLLHSFSRCFPEELGKRISVMLGLADVPASHGQQLPQGWHFALIDCSTPNSILRRDGFPGLGIPLPDIDLPRLLAGGRKVVFNRPLIVGAPLVRTSAITGVKHKDGPAGPVAVINVEHTISEGAREQYPSGPPAICEEQTYILLRSRYDGESAQRAPVPPEARPIKTVRLDQTLLFQFSALSFNSHKIHLDRDYARNVEGYPDLVVNGGLTTLLMTEIARGQLGLKINSLTVRNKAPLFCDRDITFLVVAGATATRILAADDNGSVAAEMEIEHDGI